MLSLKICVHFQPYVVWCEFDIERIVHNGPACSCTLLLPAFHIEYSHCFVSHVLNQCDVFILLGVSYCYVCILSVYVCFCFLWNLAWMFSKATLFSCIHRSLMW